jgi:hypothetical protein
MLDIPKLGLAKLDSIMFYLAQYEDDATAYEDSMALLETCKGLVGHTQLKEALSATSSNARDHLFRERDVQRSLMEVTAVRRMF